MGTFSIFSMETPNSPCLKAFRLCDVPAFRHSGIPALRHSGIPAFRPCRFQSDDLLTIRVDFETDTLNRQSGQGCDPIDGITFDPIDGWNVSTDFGPGRPEIFTPIFSGIKIPHSFDPIPLHLQLFKLQII